jgi:hypothetical protein
MYPRGCLRGDRAFKGLHGLHAETGHQRPFFIVRGRLDTVPQVVQPGVFTG